MYQLKTQLSDASVTKFIETFSDIQKISDCTELVTLFQEVTWEPAKMWGEKMIGFWSYKYSSKGGYDAEYFLTGFAPRKDNITLYIMMGLGNYKDILENIGKYKASGQSCMQIKKLSDIDVKVLKKLVEVSLKDMKKKYC